MSSEKAIGTILKYLVFANTPPPALEADSPIEFGPYPR